MCCSLLESHCSSAMHTHNAPGASFPFNIGYFIFKILLTFLLSTASCNFFICLLFQTLQDSCFSQQSAPASQVSPSAYPLPAHFPSSSLLLPEVNTFIQCLQSFCLPTSDEASLMHTAPLCSASSASWAPADPPYILRGAGRQRF